MIRQIKQRLKNMRAISGLLSDAERIANNMGEKDPGAEHLILAAFDMPDGTAASAFRKIAGEPELFRRELDRQQAQSLRDIGIEAGGLKLDEHDISVARSSVPGSKISARKTLREMAGNTGFWEAKPVTGFDVLLAVATLRYGVAVKVLESLGVDRLSLERVTNGH